MVKNADKFELVEAKMDDIDLLLEWSNDSECRKNSFNSEKIEYSEHKKWFLNKMSDKNCKIYLYVYNKEKIGQVRLELQESTGLIGYSIKKQYRGQGHGSKILSLLENKLENTDNTKIKYLAGKVKVENQASQKVFEKLGYTSEIKDGYVLYTKTLSRKDVKAKE